MNIIEKARELGAVVQQDECYKTLVRAREANDADTELNGMIGKLNLLQMSFQNESAKEEPNDEKLKEYDKEFKEVYTQVMQNPNMQAYQIAKNEIDLIMQDVMQLLSRAIQGEDPATLEIVHENECTGSCATCGGCH